MAEQITMGRLLMPPIFTNKETSLSAQNFINKFDTFKDLNELSSREAAKHFGLFLGDGPSTWLQTIPEEIKQNYEMLKEMFLKTYSAGGTFFNAYTLYSREMKEGEKLESYLSDLYKLFSSSDFSEEHKVAVFCRGLRPELQEFVIGSKPKTLLQATESARLKISLLANQK